MTVNHYLVFDISNLLHRTFFANKSEDEETIAGLAHHQALTMLNKYFREYNPNKVVMTFDRSSWRKAYTNDPDLCISGRPYKGNRRKDMSPAQQAKYREFLKLLNEFEDLMREQSAVVCLGAALLEADDLVGGFVDAYGDDNRITIVSADQDFIQLLRNENIDLIDPATGKSRRPLLEEEYDGDVDFFMFQKCLRGDAGDNVMSALPRIRKTRIRKAYTEPYEHANLMQETWTVGIPDTPEFREFRVKDLFEENRLLMDLRAQPEEIRELICGVIEKEMADPGKYSHFHFLRFLGKYELRKIKESIDNFVPMLSR
jgi:hypothetical protein